MGAASATRAAEANPSGAQTPTTTEQPISPRPSAGGTRPSQAPGSLVVSANVPGATVTLDGKPEMSGAVPFSVQSLPPGIHSVSVTKDGYNSAQRSITVEPGKASNISVELTVPAGEINIETTPSGIETLIDGQLVGKTPVQKSVGVGKHNFTLRVPGMDPYTSSFEIRYDGYIVTKKITLSGAAASTGIVEVRTTPAGATVVADGKPLDGTTPTSFRLPPGRHLLKISLDGYRPLIRDVEVTVDGTAPVNERLTPQ